MAEDILHYSALRIRVKGSGNLLPTLFGLDDTTAKSLQNIVMSNTPGREATVLTNFQGQRVRYKLQVFDISEVFNINRIVIYAKTLWKSYPQP